MSKCLSLLGATGSIGLQALDVAEKLNYTVAAMAAGSRVEAFEQQIRKWRPSLVAMADEKVAAAIAGKTIVKEIVVPGKLVNIVVKG